MFFEKKIENTEGFPTGILTDFLQKFQLIFPKI